MNSGTGSLPCSAVVAMRQPENEKSRPDGNRAGLEKDRAICFEDTKFDALAEEHRFLIGAIVNASPTTRDKVFAMLGPGDLDTPLAADALEILRVLHQDGVTNRLELTEQFAATVYDRARAQRRPGDPIPARYPCGPITWLAHAYSDAARFDDYGAAILALPYAGTGRRRALAEAAFRLARAAQCGEADHDDLASLVDKLLPLLGAYRAAVGR